MWFAQVMNKDGRMGYTLSRAERETFFVPAENALEEVFKTLAGEKLIGFHPPKFNAGVFLQTQQSSV